MIADTDQEIFISGHLGTRMTPHQMLPRAPSRLIQEHRLTQRSEASPIPLRGKLSFETLNNKHHGGSNFEFLHCWWCGLCHSFKDEQVWSDLDIHHLKDQICQIIHSKILHSSSMRDLTPRRSLDIILHQYLWPGAYPGKWVKTLIAPEQQSGDKS